MYYPNAARSPMDWPDCYNVIVYESYPSASNSWLWIGCGQNTGIYNVRTFYQEVPATAVAGNGPPVITVQTVQVDASERVGLSSSVPVPTATSTEQTTRLATTANDTTAANSSATASSSSQAWIAGAVIGPIAAVAGVASLAFWMRRRRRTDGKNAVAGDVAKSELDGGQSVHVGSGSESSGGGSPAISNSNSTCSTCGHPGAERTRCVELGDYRRPELEA